MNVVLRESLLRACVDSTTPTESPVRSTASGAAAAAAVVLFQPELKLFAAGLLLIRFGLILFEMRRITRRLSEKGLMRAVPLYDLCSPLYEAWMAADRKFRRSPGLWR